jgi:hypothetical protein
VRQEYPDIAHGYDDLTSKSYNSLVQAEIAKGCSPVVAAQRVCHLYPDAAQSAISKSADSDAARFMKVVIDIMQRDRCSRTEAMTKARREGPGALREVSKTKPLRVLVGGGSCQETAYRPARAGGRPGARSRIT